MKSCSSFKAQFKLSFLCEYYNDVSLPVVLSEMMAHPGSDPVFMLSIYLCMNSPVLADDTYSTLCSLVGWSGGGGSEGEEQRHDIFLVFMYAAPQAAVDTIWLNQIS